VEGLIEGRCAQGFGISVKVWCKLVAEACICAEHRYWFVVQYLVVVVVVVVDCWVDREVDR
jgi:hypothetical protein